MSRISCFVILISIIAMFGSGAEKKLQTRDFEEIKQSGELTIITLSS